MINYCKAIVKDYVHRLKEEGIDAQDNPSVVVGPLLCVGSAVAMPKPHDSLITMSEVYTVAIKFSVMYIHVDSYIDSPTVSQEEKTAFVAWMCNPSTDGDCPRKQKLLEIRKYLQERYADANLWIDELIKTTVLTYRTQYNRNATKKQLLKACTHKGGVTLLTLYRLIYGTGGREIYEIGSCMQLLDDIIDCTKDVREEVNTYCTCVHRKHIWIDKCAIRLVRMLSRISDEYFGIVGAMCLSLKYTILKSGNFSPGMRIRIGLASDCKKSTSFLTHLENIIGTC